MQDQTAHDSSRQWWKEAVVYQIYPRSFKDSNGDGIGDLRGIISKIDYLSSLGIDVIWLNPIFASPNVDNGYDISDYREIMDQFGVMADFDELLQKLHEKNIKLVLDLVVNHSSDEHQWFKERPDFYHWWPASQGVPPKRYSYLAEGNNAWTFQPEKDASYLHYFAKKQPDLNWENPELREEIYQMMEFWFKKGIDGFRMDVIPLISKDLSFPVLPEGSVREISEFYASGPRLHEYLQEMHEKVLSKYDVMTVAEGLGSTQKTALDYVDPARGELQMLYHFEGMDIETDYSRTGRKFDLLKFKQVYSSWDKVFAEKGWGTIYLGNHDQPRMVTRWGDDRKEFRRLSSKLLTTFILTMRGTAYYYQGDELGMKNTHWNNIGECDDIELKNLMKSGRSEAEVLLRANTRGRDNARTPFPWLESEHAGFTTGLPWIKLSEDFIDVNVEAQEKDPDSELHYFRRMIKLRKDDKVLSLGSYQDKNFSHPDVYAYERRLECETLLIVLNFSDQHVKYELPDGCLLMNNYAGELGEFLLPWQALIFKMP